MLLNEKNILFTSEKDIKKICEEIFNKLCLTYFSYGKFYYNGDCILLCTNSNVFTNHFAKNYKLTVPPKLGENNKDIFNLIVVDNESPEIIIDEHKFFNHGAMVDVLRIFPNYYEMFCFVSDKNNDIQVNKFFNNKENLEIFCDLFLEKINPMTKYQGNSIIHLPEKMIPEIKYNASQFSYNIMVGSNNYSLSKRQFQTLVLLSKGKSLKEIGKFLKIEASTVSDHLAKIRIDIGISSKSKLISIAQKNKLNTYSDTRLLEIL